MVLNFMRLFSVRSSSGKILNGRRKESTVVDAMWGAGSEESAERWRWRAITSTRTITP